MKRSRTAVLAALALGLTLTGSAPWQGSTADATAQAASTPDPLDPLTPAEVSTTFSTIEAYSKFPRGALFPIVKLNEPNKSDVLAGRSTPREAFADVYDPAKNVLYEAVVDLNAKRVVGWTAKPGAQPALSATDYVNGDTIVRGDPRWQSAMRARGLNPDVPRHLSKVTLTR